jgi:hypothetical protein
VPSTGLRPWRSEARRRPAVHSRQRRSEHPLWVRLGLWGLPNRAAAWAFVWISLASAAACIVYGLWNPRFLVGSLFVLAAIMYWLTIRWVDRNGTWER